MNRLRGRIHHDERGATLILAVTFLVVISAISAGIMSLVTSGINDRGVLDGVRNRQYSADAGVEYEIARVRSLALPGASIAPADCVSPGDVRPAFDAVAIRVNCTNAPTLTIGSLLQRNVIFAACVDTGVACTDATTIVRAQVNFQGIDTISRTWVQSWSVNQ